MGLLAAPLVRALRTRPWTRAPLLLRRQPAVLVAVAGAAAVLAATAAAPPLFASSVGTAALQRQVAARCPDTVAPFTQGFGTQEQVDTALATVPLARGVAVRTLVAPAVGRSVDVAAAADAGPTLSSEAAFVVRPGAEAAVRVLADAGGRGVLVPDTLAAATGVQPGRTLFVRSGARIGQVRVRAVYADLTPVPTAELPDTLCQLRGAGFFRAGLESSQPPAVVFCDEETLSRLDEQVTFASVQPFDDQDIGLADLDLAHARQVVAGLGPARAALRTAGGTLAGELPQVVALSLAVRSSVSGATGPVSVAGTLVALLLVAGAGGFWLERRRQEVRLLASRGVGPVALGMKAALELLPPVAVGTAGGWALALVVVRVAAPSSRIEAGVPATAAGHAVALAGVGLLLLGVVGGLGGRATTERAIGARSSRWRLVPVELLLVAGAVLAASRLRPAGAQVAAGTAVAAVDRQLLVFPLLLLAGAVALALRVLLLTLRGVRGRGGADAARPRRPAGWLAARRVLGAPAIAVSLFAAAALPVGVLVYSTGLTAGTRATLDAKTDVYVGSDAEVSIIDTPGASTLPDGFRPEATVVRVLSRVTSGQPVDLHGVEPTTFADVAAWDPSYSSSSLHELMRRITVGHRLAPGEALPVLAVGRARALGDGPALSLRLDADTVVVPTRVVGRAVAVGGLRAQPLFVADAAALEGLGQTDDLQVLARSDPPTLRGALQAAERQTTFALDPRAVVGAASFLPITWTFGYLQALAALTGLLTVGAVLLHLEVRQRPARSRTPSPGGWACTAPRTCARCWSSSPPCSCPARCSAGSSAGSRWSSRTATSTPPR